MKPLRSIPLLAALCCTALSNPLPESGRTKKLGDIFNVWGVDSSTDPPGKMILKGRNDVRARNFLDPTLPHSCADLYRHDEEAMDSELELNSRWAQSIAMNEAALQALFNPTARVLSHNVNHASAFFDLYDLREQREKSVLEHVRRQYQGIDAMMRGRGVPETKPILVCGSEQFLVRQKLTDPYKDGSDNVIKDPTTRKPVTLQDRIPKEAQDDSIYRVGPPFNSYLLIDDSTKFPSRDPKSGTLHYCQGQGEAALTMKLGYGDGSKEQTAVMVCRGDLLGDTEDLERIAVEPQRPGTSLDDMDIRAGTFYHEMFHLLDKAFGGAEVTGDALAAIVKQKQGWPLQKSSWTFDESLAGSTGIAALYHNLYDQAIPVEADLTKTLALTSPNTYAWFGLVSAMSARTKQDWSTGVCREPGSVMLQSYAIAPRERVPNNLETEVGFTEQELEQLAVEESKDRKGKGDVAAAGPT